MGRSVSYPADALVAFTETPEDDPYCLTCGTNVEDGACMCEDPDEQVWTEAHVDWDWITEDLRETAKELWPSLWDDDGWLGREDRILASNGHVHFGTSEYCGLRAVWMVARDDIDHAELAEAWLSRIEDKFLKTFGTLQKVGTFSNGEAVYQRKS